MIAVRRSDERGRAQHGWLDSRHTFSFADYYDPAHMGFGPLRVINEDRVAPGAGFGRHGHRDMEILSYVLDGALAHKDSLGTSSTIRPGEVQRMSAGTGIQHSEFNASQEQLVHFLQIWILPERGGIAPGYEQKAFTLERGEGLTLVASRDGREGAITIHQDVDVYAARLPAGGTAAHALRAGRLAWLQVARGEVALNGVTLAAGDGAAVEQETALRIEAAAPAESCCSTWDGDAAARLGAAVGGVGADGALRRAERPRMTAGSGARPAAEQAVSPWAPLRRPLFLALWIATVVSNIGTWMQNAAAGWLMTELSPTPLIVALVQVAASAPMFLLGLPAGALADILDRRRLLIVVQSIATLIVAVLAALVGAGWVTPSVLLVFTFLVAAASALIAPAWQAIVPQLVPRAELAAGISLNSVGFNVSRAIGPALAGVMIGVLGMAAPFWINAASNLGVIAILIWWRAGSAAAGRLPAEGFVAAMRTGLRHARDNAHLKATLVRTAAFFLLASAYWALLPLVARTQVQGGPGLYGMLLGAIGAGAVGGAFLLPWLKARLGADKLAIAGTLGTAVATLLFGLAQHVGAALAASALAGVAWIAVLATINVSAQVALPPWVRGRGLALFGTVQFGAMTAGSLLWGAVASASSLPVAHFLAAGALLASVPLLGRWKLHTAAGLDLTPSMHWPTPVVSAEVEADRGPVLVTVEYQVEPGNRAAFLSAVAELGAERRRDGAFSWQLFEDAAREGRYVETFYVESWRDHLRQHERVTHADRELQQAVRALHAGGDPAVRHLIAVVPPDRR